MKKNLANLQRVRIRRLGYVLLVALIVCLLVNNRAIYWLLGKGGPSNWYQGLLAAMCGVVFAEFSLLAIWSVLSPHSLWRRVMFLICAAAALVSSWLLGFANTRVPEESIRWFDQEEICVLGFLPMVFLSHALPLLGARFFWSVVLVQDDITPRRHHVSITGLLAATAMIALVFAAAQLPTRLGMTQAEVYAIAGIASGIAFAFGLLGTLPATLLLFSRRRNFWIWSILLVLYAGGITALVFGILRQFRISPPNSTWIFASLSVGFMIVVSLGIGIIRLFGYRLGRAARDNGKSVKK